MTHYDASPCTHTDIEMYKCWHRPCELRLTYRDGSVWLLNEAGYARRFPVGDFRKDGDS